MLAAGLRVIVPRIPDKDLVKPDVLVMEYCDGFSVREVSDYKKHKVDKEKLLERICTSWAVQMHIDGIFNADPHPGITTVCPTFELANTIYAKGIF